MTRSTYRRWVRLQNHLPLIFIVLAIGGSGAYAIDRIASLGARLARAML